MDIPSRIDHTSSSEEMIRLLERAEGVDLRTLDKGERGLEELWQEIQERDMILSLNETDNRADYLAWSTRIEIFDHLRKLYWVQIGRRIKNRVWKGEKFALRETRKRNETSKETAIRVLKEEAGIELLETEELTLLMDPTSIEATEVYESSAYQGLRAVKTYTDFSLVTSRFATESESRRRLKIIIDRGSEHERGSVKRPTKSYIAGFPY